MTSTSSIMAAAPDHFNNGSVEQDPFRHHVICHSWNVACRSDRIPSLPFAHMVQIRQAVPSNHHNPGQAVTVPRELCSVPVRKCTRKGYPPVPFLGTPKRMGSLHLEKVLYRVGSRPSRGFWFQSQYYVLR